MEKILVKDFLLSKNPNHPKKGDRIKVEPIRNLYDIEYIKKKLSNRPRDYLLFVLGINTNLRASDFLNLTIGQVRYLNYMDDLEIREKKTQKARRLSLNQVVIDAISIYLKTIEKIEDTAPLFRSQRKNRSLTVPSTNRLVKSWCKMAQLNGNYGSHTLRKTWGDHQRVTFKVDIPTLMECFNHSNQRQTLSYLCVQPEEVKRVYANEL